MSHENDWSVVGSNCVIPMYYGLVATFAIDRMINLKTVRVRREVYDNMLKRSLFYLLGWAQRSVLLSERGYALKEKLARNVTLDDELNRYLISYYESMNGRCPALQISNDRGKYGIADVYGDDVIVTEVRDDKYLLFVKINHRGVGAHQDLVPLLSLNDV